MDTMIELPAMRRTAELAPNTADAQARTVEVIWSAGARVRRASFFGEPYDEELSLDPAHVRLERLNAGAPFLKVHELGALDAVIAVASRPSTISLADEVLYLVDGVVVAHGTRVR